MLSSLKRVMVIIIAVLIINCTYSYTQASEYRIIRTVRKLCLKKHYVRAEELLKLRLKMEELPEEEIKEIHVYLGFIYLKLNKLYMAEMEFEEAVRLDPVIELIDEVFDEEAQELMKDIKENTLGSLKIATVPDSADVYINKKKVGVTPLIIRSVYSDNIDITIMKQNYHLINRDIYVFPAETTNVRVVLRWSDFLGILEVRTSPEEADVYINDLYTGESPVFFTGLGQYKIRMEKEGYVSETRIVDLKRRETTRFLQFLLEKRDQLLYSQLIPGLGQFRHGYIKHGIFFSSLTLGYLVYYFNYVHDNNPLRGLPLLKSYGLGQYYIGDRMVSGPEYTTESQRREQALYDFDNKKTRLSILGIGLYLLNCVDTFFIIRKDMQKKREQEKKKYDFDVQTNSQTSKITLNYRF